jgi:mediator of RNA polymerase II transcription subunit 6
MKNMYALAAEMQFFTPSHGHRYAPIASKPSAVKELDDKQLPSQGNTPMPDASQQQQNISHPPNQARLSAPMLDTEAYRRQFSLVRSMNISLRYREEFMDTNPLLGDPGSLKFTSTETHLQAQAAARKKAAAEDRAAREILSTSVSRISSPMMDSRPLENRKGSKAEKTVVGGAGKTKRRKSRIGGSPGDDDG